MNLTYEDYFILTFWNSKRGINLKGLIEALSLGSTAAFSKMWSNRNSFQSSSWVRKHRGVFFFQIKIQHSSSQRLAAISIFMSLQNPTTKKIVQLCSAQPFLTASDLRMFLLLHTYWNHMLGISVLLKTHP